MFPIPGIIISLITFPGVIVHEFAHQIFCRWFKVPVFQVVYFQMENPVGYVLHEIPKHKLQTVMISIGPFLVNSILGCLIAMPSAMPFFEFHNPGLLDYALIYLGVSIAMHAFPSTGDAESIWSAVKDKDTPLLIKVISYPVVGLIYLGAIGSFFWLDLVYGIAIAVGLPRLIISILA